MKNFARIAKFSSMQNDCTVSDNHMYLYVNFIAKYAISEKKSNFAT
jgi:hypothetical protein